MVLDVCPVSNLRTGAVASLAAHPLPALVAAGVRCSLATDDPAMFDTDLGREHGHGRSGRPGLRGGGRLPVAVELGVAAVGGHQLVVAALLDDPAALEHDDAVGVADRATGGGR